MVIQASGRAVHGNPLSLARGPASLEVERDCGLCTSQDSLSVPLACCRPRVGTVQRTARPPPSRKDRPGLPGRDEGAYLTRSAPSLPPPLPSSAEARRTGAGGRGRSCRLRRCDCYASGRSRGSDARSRVRRADGQRRRPGPSSHRRCWRDCPGPRRRDGGNRGSTGSGCDGDRPTADSLRISGNAGNGTPGRGCATTLFRTDGGTSWTLVVSPYLGDARPACGAGSPGKQPAEDQPGEHFGRGHQCLRASSRCVVDTTKKAAGYSFPRPLFTVCAVLLVGQPPTTTVWAHARKRARTAKERPRAWYRPRPRGCNSSRRRR